MFKMVEIDYLKRESARLAQKLRSELDRLKIKQKDFADILGIKPNTLSNYLNAKGIPDNENYELIAAYFGYSLGEFKDLMRGSETIKESNGNYHPSILPKTATEIILLAQYLSKTEQLKLIKMLVDKQVEDICKLPESGKLSKK